MDVIDTNVDLKSHDYKRLHLHDLMGQHGLIVVGVGRGGERGFQMVYRFSDICDRLENEGVNAAFVYRKESARHVFDATSLFGARFRLTLHLLLDDAGLFFRGPPQDRSLRAVHFNHALRKSVKIFCSTSTFRYDDRPASAGGQRRCPQHEAVDSRLTAVPSLPTGSPRASPSA